MTPHLDAPPTSPSLPAAPCRRLPPAPSRRLPPAPSPSGCPLAAGFWPAPRCCRLLAAPVLLLQVRTPCCWRLQERGRLLLMLLMLPRSALHLLAACAAVAAVAAQWPSACPTVPCSWFHVAQACPCMVLARSQPWTSSPCPRPEGCGSCHGLGLAGGPMASTRAWAAAWAAPRPPPPSLPWGRGPSAACPATWLARGAPPAAEERAPPPRGALQPLAGCWPSSGRPVGAEAASPRASVRHASPCAPGRGGGEEAWATAWPGQHGRVGGWTQRAQSSCASSSCVSCPASRSAFHACPHHGPAGG